ncbi:MAG: aspartyl protease family protein [Planctomycetota bacterium]
MRRNYMMFSGFILFVILLSSAVVAEEVNWQGPAGSRIKEIRYSEKEAQPQAMAAATAAATTTTEAVLSNVIDSPPPAGFVPWIVITATDEYTDAELTGDYTAEACTYTGDPPGGTYSQTDFFIGLFDTGASAHVIGYHNAVKAGLYNDTYLTEKNEIEVSGVTGSVFAHVTHPYALFMDGLDALEPNAPGESEMVLPFSTASEMVGESNVATLIGKDPETNPETNQDLATAIGTPMSVFYDAHIEVDQMITVTQDGTEYTAPRITFYDKDNNDPNYPNYIPLELKPLGAADVQYVTYGFDPEDLEDIILGGFELDYSPLTPSIVMGTSSQSLFFVHSVDITEGIRTAQDRDRFMIDTGAQVTVIGDRVAARLGLNPNNWDFQVEIEGVTGESIKAPGFYLDSLTIPAVGQWLEFTNVPVVMLEISSPEGGKLDGIIGMNLFTEYNLILRSGGMGFEDDPRLEFERISTGPVVGDIAPETRDGQVDMLDFSVFSAAWLAEDSDGNWNADADLEPAGDSEGVINLQDLTVLAENWLTSVTL